MQFADLKKYADFINCAFISPKNLLQECPEIPQCMQKGTKQPITHDSNISIKVVTKVFKKHRICCILMS